LSQCSAEDLRVLVDLIGGHAVTSPDGSLPAHGDGGAPLSGTGSHDNALGLAMVVPDLGSRTFTVLAYILRYSFGFGTFCMETLCG
jgi:hypothetical protein